MTVLLILASIVIVLCLCFVIYHQHLAFVAELQSSRSSYLSASSAHDQSYLKMIDKVMVDNLQRELALRGEIQSLTEALARSKESVPVVYPRDLNRPLEPSPGWFDSRPVITKVGP